MARGHADVVVVAAGSSERFGRDKLEADVAGRPVLAWTLDRLAASRLVERIVVVTAADRVDRIGRAPWLASKVVAVVPGGRRRQDSVAQGIAAVDELDATVPDEAADRVVLVHDGARPMVEDDLIARVIAAVAAHGAAVPVLPIVETVKRIGPGGRIVETIDRTGLGVVQTPQGATLGTFKRALHRAVGDRGPVFTDEAALLEACNIPVHAIPGDERNFKVTVPADLARLEDMIGSGDATAKVGIGSDSHPFGPRTGLALGGLVIEGAPRLHGHSDGDVVLHAVADALLGAAGLGDLGRVFPAGPATARGIASTELLSEIVRRVRSTGFGVRQLDCTIVAARPRLAPLLDSMATRIAELVGADAASVNVKASTGNLDGMEGAGRGISASAAAVLVRSASSR